jgi:hypothetical protein
MTHPARTESDARPPSAAAPVIVLTYGYAGGRQLQQLLQRVPGMACTAGTGILGACRQAAEAWRAAEGRSPGDPVSAVAATSIRQLVTGMLTILMARTGSRRWCETVAAEPDAVETFLSAFPATRLVCLHRSCPDVIYSAIHDSPWGIAGPGFGTYIAAYPNNLLVALAAWWIARARSTVEFESGHPESCLRVRYEDLVLRPEPVTGEIAGFLGLPPGSVGGDEGWLAAPAEITEDGRDPDAPGCGRDFPAGQLPSGLVDQVNQLHAQLGYPPLSPVTG